MIERKGLTVLRGGFLVLVLLILAPFAFCNGSGESQQKVTLTWNVEEGQMTYAPAAVQEFNKTHPNIEIKLEKYPWIGSTEMMTTRFIGGQAAPIISLHYSWLINFASLGYLANLDSFLKGEDLSDFWPDVLAQFSYNGGYYGLPVFADTYGYVYNLKMYEEAGLDPNKPPQNWDELLTHLQKLNKPEKKQYGMVAYFKAGDHMGANFVNTFIRQNMGDVLSPDYSHCILNEPAAVEATQFVADLFLKHKVISPSSMEYFSSEAATAFAMGEAATIQTASVLAAAIYTKNPNMKMFSAPWPKGKQWKGPRGYGWGIGISNNTPYKKQAMEFVKFLTSKQGSQDYIIGKGNYLGPRISVTKANPMLGKQPYVGLITAMEKGYSFIDPPLKNWQPIALTELDYLQQIFLGKASVQDTLNKATVAINELLKK